MQNEGLINRLVELTECRYVKKGDFIVHAGEAQNDVWLMETGIARGYLLDANGDDVTDCFIFRPGSAAMAISNLEPGISSPLAIEMLEDGKFYCVPISTVVELQQHYNEISILYTHLLADSLNMHWRLKRVLTQYTAPQRYEWFLKEYPGLIDRISKKYIASFLGMSPVTISRIRKTLRDHDKQG